MRTFDPPLTISGWLRYDIIQRALDETPGIERVLEIGPGVGGVAVRLAQRFEYVGVEQDALSASIVEERLNLLGRGEVRYGGLEVLPADRRFDLVCAFEVLEHQEDDAGALREWCARVAPGGWLLLSVPGFMRHYGEHDRRAGHFRRYERDGLGRLLAAVDLESIRIWTYGFPLNLGLPRLQGLAASRRASAPTMQERTSASGRVGQPPPGWGRVPWAASQPVRWLQRLTPNGNLGIGLIALARRGAVSSPTR